MINFNIEKIAPLCAEFGITLDETKIKKLNLYGNLLLQYPSFINAADFGEIYSTIIDFAALIINVNHNIINTYYYITNTFNITTQCIHIIINNSIYIFIC